MSTTPLLFLRWKEVDPARRIRVVRRRRPTQAVGVRVREPPAVPEVDPGALETPQKVQPRRGDDVEPQLEGPHSRRPEALAREPAGRADSVLDRVPRSGADERREKPDEE